MKDARQGLHSKVGDAVQWTAIPHGGCRVHPGAGPNLFSLTVANHAVVISLLINFQAGTLKSSPRLNTAQHIRAFLAAIATTALP